MTLQASGPISFQQINVELNKTATATISLNDEAVRKLLGKASGTISMQDAYGKSSEIRFVNSSPRTSASVFALMGSPTVAASYVFINNSTFNASTYAYALRTGVFPAGSTLTIINNGYIYGLGGTGSSDVTVPGGPGGDAIYLDMPCQIDNSNGYIFAGGGGGGSAKRVAKNSPSDFISAGGGGGAGTTMGAAGTNTYKTYENTATTQNIAPIAGTTIAGGAGGTVSAGIKDTYIDTAYGGAGGANGVAGAVGSTTTVIYSTLSSYKDTPTVGVGGAGGYAVNTGRKKLTKVAGFDSSRVKGVVI